MKLDVDIAGLSLKSPLILASGVLGVSFSSMKRFIEAGGGAVTTKSIGPIPRKGYRNPSIIELQPGTFINAIGLGNPGIDDFLSEIKEIKRNKIPLIVSVFGNSNESYLDVALKAENGGADAIEINISCPHAEVSSIGIDKNLTYELVSMIKSKLSIPLLVKLNPNVTNLNDIALAAEKGGADGVVAINTISAMAIDVNTRRPFLAHGSGGLSGKAIHPIAVKKIYDLYKVLKIPIIGCGGASNWKEIIEFFLAGASAVQIGSALHEGMDVLEEMREGMLEYLRIHDFSTINDIQGLAHDFKLQEMPDFD
ncbi:MAG: dihydroorotate dehydrogenase [Promethearchaeota archaeon]